jgi:hypothetical protein
MVVPRAQTAASTVQIRHGAVAHVLQVGDAHAAGPEAGRRQIAKAVEERDTVEALGRGPQRPGNVVEHRRAFVSRTVQKRLVEPALAFEVEPGQPAAHRNLARRLVEHDEVHEFRHAGVGGAPRPIVLRDDQIDEDADGLPFVRREELRL